MEHRPNKPSLSEAARTAAKLKQARLAAELRSNLRKRKAQSEARTSGLPDLTGAETASKGLDSDRRQSK
jgi:hypothetical protein